MTSLEKTQSALWTGYRQPRHGTNTIEYFRECLGSNMGFSTASSGAISKSTKTGYQQKPLLLAAACFELIL